MREFRMPKIALGADDEVRVVEWIVDEGGEVASGEPLLEVETDKAAMEVEATSDGVLAKQLAAAGEVVLPGAVIGLIADTGEQYDLTALPVASGESAPPVGAGRLDPAVATPAIVPPEPERTAAVGPRVSLRHGYLAGLPPARRAGSPAGSPARQPVDPHLVGGSHQIIEPTKHRSAVARAMSASAAVPQFPVFSDIDVTGACRALDRVRSATPETTLTDLVVVAVAATLRRHPAFNSWYDGTRRIEFADINLNVAVDGPDGVVAPVIRHVDKLSLEELVRDRQDLVERARRRRLVPGDLIGGTFTLSNLGALGASAVAPMIIVPQVAVLGVGRLRTDPGARLITMTLVSDHRAVDGADAARFLAGLADALNDPEGGR
ncbi:MAG: dihydrolipoamide acetyltransferase family protein [Acidimicrobiaceae bacterium]|nr:dihydrolipoamide acetyltransferase family protein [Acidimicrobiaceae bacterium]